MKQVFFKIMGKSKSEVLNIVAPCAKQSFSLVKTAGILLTAGLILAGLSACSTDVTESTSGLNTLTAEEEREGWELVFNGQTLDGWRGVNMDDIPEEHWVVENGMLKKVARDSVSTDAEGRPLPGGDILLDRTVNNFEFAFEWKVTSVANSGIKYNVLEELTADQRRPIAALGFEYQVLDDPEYPDVKDNPSMGTSGLYDLVDPEVDVQLNPKGEWNSGRIVYDGNHGEHWLNGERVLTFELGTPEMDAALAASKWSDNEEFGIRNEDSFIVIQDHSSEVWYRNLKLKELP